MKIPETALLTKDKNWHFFATGEQESIEHYILF